jgi:hypothetical protein
MLLTISLTLHTRHAYKALCLAMKDRRVHMIVRSVTAKGRGPKMFVLWPVRRLASSVRSDVYFTDFVVVTQHELSPPSPLSLSLPPNGGSAAHQAVRCDTLLLSSWRANPIQ